MDKLDLIYDVVRGSSAKLEVLSDKVTSLEVNTDKNTESLVEHMRRTELNEHRIEHIENKLLDKIEKIEKRFTLKWITKTVSTTVISVSAFLGAALYIYGIMNGK